MVELRNGHLLLKSGLARQMASILDEKAFVKIVFYPKEAKLMLASHDDEWFSSIHKAKAAMLKNKNLQGDKVVALREILMDNEIDEQDRQLTYHYDQDLCVLQVTL